MSQLPPALAALDLDPPHRDFWSHECSSQCQYRQQRAYSEITLFTLRDLTLQGWSYFTGGGLNCAAETLDGQQSNNNIELLKPEYAESLISPQVFDFNLLEQHPTIQQMLAVYRQFASSISSS
jgi:hypothetical protein